MFTNSFRKLALSLDGTIGIETGRVPLFSKGVTRRRPTTIR